MAPLQPCTLLHTLACGIAVLYLYCSSWHRNADAPELCSECLEGKQLFSTASTAWNQFETSCSTPQHAAYYLTRSHTHALCQWADAVSD